jgi:two-component system chemotaxis response regulator CheY
VTIGADTVFAPRVWGCYDLPAAGFGRRAGQEEPMAKRVLVVDDAIFMRNMIKDIFSGGGFEVVGEAANGLEAVEKYRELRPDLTTMDIVMPFKSGIDATRDIVKQDPKAVIVMCSALGQESLVMEAIEAGASDFIVKPFKSEDVLNVVKKVLGA